MNNDLLEAKINKLKQEIDYLPVLEACCKRILNKYLPYPTQCSLDYLYDGQRLNRIRVKIDDDITSISYVRPYELQL